MYFQNRYKLITIYFTKTVRNKPFLALKHFIFSIYKRASAHVYRRGKPQLKIKNMNDERRRTEPLFLFLLPLFAWKLTAIFIE